jgi:phage I-like protein
LKDGGEIWANVSWNDDGEQSILKKEYKYISPAINYKEVTKEIVFIGGASLTNDPALTMQALCCNDKADDVLLAELSAFYGVKDASSLTDLLSGAVSQETDKIIEGCFSRGIINRALEDDLRVICQSIGISRFNVFMKKLESNIETLSQCRTALFNMQDIPGTRKHGQDNINFSDSENDVCKTLGVSRESFIKAKGNIKNGR